MVEIISLVEGTDAWYDCINKEKMLFIIRIFYVYWPTNSPYITG
jgi:hypothetical protein